MKQEVGSVEYGKGLIQFAVVRRRRATLEIAVEPDSTVVVAAPMRASIEEITAKVRKRASWVRPQQQFFSQFVPKTPPRHYIPGETHLYLGRQYRLKVAASNKRGVKLRSGFLVVECDEPKRPDLIRELLNSWYRAHASVRFAERLEACLDRFPNREGLRPKQLIIRQLRRRWGSLSPTRRMLLNLRLIQAPVDSIDYVITHELCHMVQPHHGPSFLRLLDRILPDWQSRKQRLEMLLY
jgi:predicted metal-dependent hydrolase